MLLYALSVIPLMLVVLKKINAKSNSHAKIVAYTIAYSAKGSISSLKYWWDTLYELGPNFCYFAEPTKSWLIVQSDCSDKAICIFKDTNIQATAQGKRHLGTAHGTSQFRGGYIV